jgi:hypothetical protein
MPRGDLLEPLGPSGCDREARAAAGELAGERLADPARGAREPDRSSGERAQKVTLVDG